MERSIFQRHTLLPKRQTVESAVMMEVYTDFDSCGWPAGEWDEFVDRISGDIFLTYDWQRIWWKYYGRGRLLRVYAFRVGEQWVGLVPMFVESIRLGPLSIRRAKPVGSDHSFGHFRPAIDPAYFEPVLRMLLEDLAGLECDQVLLGPLAGRYSHAEAFIRSLHESGGDFRLGERRYEQIYYRLEADYERWLKGLKTSRRKSIQREFRRIDKLSISFTLTSAEEDTFEAMFDEFVQLHQRNWNEQGKLGHFGDWPRSRMFHKELARAQMKAGRLRLLRICFSDGSFSYAYNFRCGDMYWEYLSARTPPRGERFSMGRILHAETVRRGIEEGVRWIDSMQGKYGYKQELGGECRMQRLAVLSRRGFGRRIRLELFGGAAKLLHLLYYKVYFCRLAMRLPLRRRRGLSEYWIRACGELRGALKAEGPV